MKILMIISLVIGLIGVVLGVVSFVIYHILCMMYDRILGRVNNDIVQLQKNLSKLHRDITLLEKKYRRYTIGIKVDGEEPPKFGDN